MRNLAVLALLVAFAACSKKSSDTNVESQSRKAESCEFGITEFNLTKRAPVTEENNKKPQPPPPPPGGGGGTTSNPGVLLLDFDGHLVSGTSWNYAGTINCVPANLSSAAMTNIMNRVIIDYSPFNIIVTTDEAVYNAASVTRRMRVIVTESWEWFGQAGGTSFLNSFTWGDNTPCFVFSSLLNYSEKNIAEASAHEAGHTLGLRHQATYNGTALVSQYNYGQGSGETGWAPIMGGSYYQNLTTWHNGPNSNGYAAFQDDVAIITGRVGLKTDDYSNSRSGAQVLTTNSMDGIINSVSDVDFFSVSLSTAKTISITPFNVGANHQGANLDLLMRIYNNQGQLLASVQDPAALNAVTLLTAGQFFISVSTTANSYASNYGMLGKYKISLN